MSKISRHVRLLPAVILVSAGLLVMKGVGLALDARAADATTQSQSADNNAGQPNSTASDPAADVSESTSVGDVDVLASLAKRRHELDDRAQDLAMRENLISAAEKRIDGKIDELKQMQAQIKALLGLRDDAEKQQLAALVKTYSGMKPKDAARIFNTLNDDVLIAVAQAMKPDVLGAVLAQMQSDRAEKLTVRLANRLKPLDGPVADTAQASQVASNLPSQASATAPTSPGSNVAPGAAGTISGQPPSAPNAPAQNAPQAAAKSGGG